MIVDEANKIAFHTISSTVPVRWLMATVLINMIKEIPLPPKKIEFSLGPIITIVHTLWRTEVYSPLHLGRNKTRLPRNTNTDEFQ